MRKLAFRRWVCSAVLAIGCGHIVAEVAWGDAIFTPATESPFRNGDWVFGNTFTVGGQDLLVSALGAFDAGGNGFISSGGIEVGLYDRTTGTLLASTFVQSSDPLNGFYRYADIGDVTLLSGKQYQVVAANRSDSYTIAQSFTVNPLVQYDGYEYSSGTSVSMQTGGLTGSEFVWMANLDVSLAPDAAPVPLPAAAWGGMALMGLVGAKRLRRRQRVAD